MYNILLISENLLLTDKIVNRLNSFLWIKCFPTLKKANYIKNKKINIIIVESKTSEKIRSRRYKNKLFILIPSISRSKRLILNRLTQIVFNESLKLKK